MPPFYRIIEILVYSLLNFLPYLILALYPFRKHLRFSKPMTVILVAVISLLQIGCGFLAALFSNTNVGILSALNTMVYFAFYFICVKSHPGKTLFILLMLSNIANLIVVVSKCMEGILAPQLALQPYRWSFSAVMLTVQFLILVPLFFYIRKAFTCIIEKDARLSAWKYLWLIPATFYLLWFYHLYGNTKSSLEIALQPKHTAFLLCINMGAFLIYHMIVCLINEYDKNANLKNQNHQLILQKLQYENLKDKISNARRAKHDLHHHITIMTGYLHDGKLEELETYLARYCKSLPKDTSVVLCQNYAVNLLLLYFEQQAKDNGIVFSVHTDIPEKLNIAENDLSVLLGNLLENAIDACLTQAANHRRIIIRGKQKNDAFLLTIDNTFEGEIKQDKNGAFISTKHSGAGLGIESARQIALRYNGVFQAEQKDGMFYVSVLLKLPD